MPQTLSRLLRRDKQSLYAATVDWLACAVHNQRFPSETLAAKIETRHRLVNALRYLTHSADATLRTTHAAHLDHAAVQQDLAGQHGYPIRRYLATEFAAHLQDGNFPISPSVRERLDSQLLHPWQAIIVSHWPALAEIRLSEPRSTLLETYLTNLRDCLYAAYSLPIPLDYRSAIRDLLDGLCHNFLLCNDTENECAWRAIVP